MKAVVFTLGCKVNECESASLIAGLQKMGYEVSDKLEEADLVLVNTCAVTSEAEKKSRQTLARVKKAAPNAKIVYLGCASQNHPEQYEKKENVTIVWGTREKSKILSHLNEEGNFVSCEEKPFDEMLPPKRLKTRSFLKIQDGCNRFCSYCIIPYLRGRSRSRSIQNIVDEVNKDGAEEIVLVGIDLSSFSDEGKTLVDLLLALSDTNKRIRLGSLEVSAVTDELLAAAKKIQKFCPQFHLSLQSGSNSVLKRMNRRYTREEYLAACDKIYKAFPSAAITTDIIVGFCEETEEEFLDSLSIVSEAKFSHVHCFPYSVREGTVAAKRFSDLPSEVKKERLSRLLTEAERASKDYRLSHQNEREEVLREEFADGYTQGYTKNYLRVYVKGDIPNAIIPVVLKEPFREGVLGEVVKDEL